MLIIYYKGRVEVICHIFLKTLGIPIGDFSILIENGSFQFKKNNKSLNRSINHTIVDKIN